MDLTDLKSQQDIDKGHGKSFGNTALSGHARAHVGDVIFEGGTHVHHHTAESRNKGPNTRVRSHDLPSADEDETQNKKHAQIVVRAITSALYFREADARRIQVRDAYKKTFSWIFREGVSEPDHFVNWLRNGAGCFWINGKAGSGKSTLMKYIHQHEAFRCSLKTWAGTRDLVIASFFFWYAGQPLQKTQEGLLRSILYQILIQRKDLTSSLFPDLFNHLLRQAQNRVTLPLLNLSLADLQGACNRLAKIDVANTVFFLLIDGIDEFEGNHLDLGLFLLDLAKSPYIKMATSSRPEPECYMVFSKCHAYIRLQDLTAGDISLYVQENLLKDELFIERDRLEDGFGQVIKETLTQKASGVFLWIVLVVKNLLSGLANYDDHETLLQKVSELPSDLEKLYDHMFGKMTEDHRREASTIFQVMRHTTGSPKGPLHPLQLFVMLKDKMRCEESTYLSSDSWQYSADIEELRVKDIEGRLRSKCCGLLEIESSLLTMFSDIVYLHRTVHRYLCDNTIWNKVKSACSLSPSTIDLALLLSNAHVLKHWAESPIPKSWIGAHVKFLSSVHCSATLEKDGETRYAGYLAFCEEASLLFGDADASSYVLVLRAAITPFISRVDRLEFDWDISPRTKSVVIAAWLGFPEYLRVRTNGWEELSNVKSSILLSTLAMVAVAAYSAMTEEVNLSNHIRLISILLETGVDCNVGSDTSVFRWLPNLLSFLMERFQQEITPWRYWLEVMKTVDSKFEHWQILSMLLHAGADSSADSLITHDDLCHVSYAAREFASRIKRPEEKAVLDKIITRLEAHIRAASDPLHGRDRIVRAVTPNSTSPVAQNFARPSKAAPTNSLKGSPLDAERSTHDKRLLGLRSFFQRRRRLSNKSRHA